jgi:hypothetical protein
MAKKVQLSALRMVYKDFLYCHATQLLLMLLLRGATAHRAKEPVGH